MLCASLVQETLRFLRWECMMFGNTKSKLHVRMVDSSSQQKPMTTFFKRVGIDTPDSMITAEVVFLFCG